MKKILGAYSLGEAIVFLMVVIVFGAWNFAIAYDYFMGAPRTDHVVFSFVFINIVFVSILAAPYFAKRAGAPGESSLAEFLELPGKDQPLRASAFSSFLSDQALGSFLATLIIITGREALNNYGPIISGVYVSVVFVVAVALVAISLARFVSYFTRCHGLLYLVASIISVGVMFSLLQFGLIVARSVEL